MVFSSLTLVSRFMGLARDLFITARLGASSTPAADAFNTAQFFPNLFRRIFSEGAFTAAFGPAYSKVLAIVALLSGVLNAGGRFALSAAAPTVLNAVILIAVIRPANAVD